MKKSVVALGLCFALGFGAFGLSACTPIINFHTISATSSNQIQGGTVEGYGQYKTNSTVTLKATPKTEGGFLAWIKNEEVVSYEPVFSFTADTDTEGSYIALFATDEFEFARLQNVEYQLNSLTVPNSSVMLLDWDLEYNTMSSLYHDLAHMEDEPLSNNDNNFFDGIDHEDKVLFSSKKYFFQLTLSLQYTNIETGDITTEPVSTKFFVDFADIFDNEAKVENGVTTYTCDEYTLHLTPMATDYGKEYTFVVSVNDFKKSNSWDNTDANNNNQLLTMTFVYKNPLL